MNTKIKKIIPILLAIFIFSFSSVLSALADGEEETAAIPAGASIGEESSVPTPAPKPGTFAVVDLSAYPNATVISTLLSPAEEIVLTNFLLKCSPVITYSSGATTVGMLKNAVTIFTPTSTSASIAADEHTLLRLFSSSLTTVNNLNFSIMKANTPFQNLTTVTSVEGGNVTGSNMAVTVISGSPNINVTGTGSLTINSGASPSLANTPSTFVNASAGDYYLSSGTTNITQNGAGTIRTTNAAANITVTAGKVVYNGAAAVMTGNINISSGELHIPNGHSGILTVSGTAKVAITGTKSGTLTVTGGTVWAQNLAATIATPISGKLIACASISSFTVNAGASFTTSKSYSSGIVGAPNPTTGSGISSGTITNNGSVNIDTNNGIVNHGAGATTTIGSEVTNVIYAGAATPKGINFVQGTSWTGSIHVGSIITPFTFPASADASTIQTSGSGKTVIIDTKNLIKIGTNGGTILQTNANGDVYIVNNNAPINDGSGGINDSTIAQGNLRIYLNTAHVVYTASLTGAHAPSVSTNALDGTVESKSDNDITITTNHGIVGNLSGDGKVDITTNTGAYPKGVYNEYTTLVTIVNSSGTSESKANINAPITITGTNSGTANNKGIGLFTINKNTGTANNTAGGTFTITTNSGTANNTNTGPMNVATNTGTVTSTGSGVVTVTKNSKTVTAGAASTGNIVVPENDAGAVVNLGGTTSGTHSVGTVGGTKNNGTVNITTIHHATTIYNDPDAIYDPNLGDAYTYATGLCQVNVSGAGSPVIYGSGYINLTNGTAGDILTTGTTGMPTLHSPGSPYIIMSAAGRVGINLGVNPTKIVGDGAALGSYRVYFAATFAGSTAIKANNGDGGANVIAFKDFDGELHVGGSATTTNAAIPAGVKTLHLDTTALNYTEQWAASTAGKKVTLFNPTTTYEVVYRGTTDNVANSFYPNATAGADPTKTNTIHRTIGVGITEMVVKAATSFKFYSTESSHSPTLHASATTGMNLGGSGGAGTFQLTTAATVTDLYFGLNTFDNLTSSYAELDLKGATSATTFTSYNDNLKINATSTKFTNVNLHNHYPALNGLTDVFNSGGDNIMDIANTSLLNLTIGAAAGTSTGYVTGTAAAKTAINVALVPKLYRLDSPRVATLIMNGLNADPTVYLTPNTTTSVTFGDGFNATVPADIKLHGSKLLTAIDFLNDHATAARRTGTVLKVLDLKVPRSHTAPLDNTDSPIDGISPNAIDKLTEVPTISGWTYVPAAGTTDKKLDLRDNAIPAIGDDFSNTNTKGLSGTRTKLTTKLSNEWINQLDVRGNSMQLLNLDEANMKAHLTNLAYVRGNQTTMRFVNLSNCEKIVNENTFTRRGTTDIVIGPDVPPTGQTNLSKVEYLWLDELPQLRIVTSTIDVLYWENNEISEFTMTNPANTKIINVDLSNNQIKHVNTNAISTTFGGTTYGTGASAIGHSNIRLTGSSFVIGTTGTGFLDLSFQKDSLVSVIMDRFDIMDIWMGYNPDLMHVELTNMPSLEDFNLRSITGKEADPSAGKAIALNTILNGTPLGTPATDALPTLPTGACTSEGVYNIPPLQVPAPNSTGNYTTNYPMSVYETDEGIARPVPGAETAVNYQLTYVDYSGSIKIPHTVTPNTGVNDSAFNIVNNKLETVKFNGCIQLGGKVLYLQNNKISRLEIKNVGATAIQGIDLSTNDIENFAYKAGAATPTPSNVDLQGTQVTEALVLSWNPIASINIDAIDIVHIDISNARTTKNTGAGGTHFRIEGEVKIVNSPNLAAVDIEDNHLVKGLNLSNNIKLNHIIGTLNTNTTNSTSDASMIEGVLNLTKTPNILDSTGAIGVIAFPGHLISNAVLVDTYYEEISLQRNNGMGESSVLTTIPAITSEADRGVLKEINISSTSAPSAAPRSTKLLNADDNIIEVVNTMNPAASNVNMSNTMFAPNSMIRMNFNNIHTFKISQTGQDGYAGLETILLDNNRMKHLEATQMAGLMYLEVDRTIYNANSLARVVTNLYNSFEDGTVTLTGSAKLVYFHPGTTVESDRLVDERVIRKNPVEPNEHQWASNANNTAASIGLAAVYTNTSATKSKLATGAPNWGYYSRVPIVSFNAIGCTNIESIRIPGNRLTSATLRLDSTASNLLYLDISGAEATDSGTSDSNYLPNPSRTRGFRPAKAGTMYDAASGQIGGAFTLQWPKLEVFRIQNNQITSLQTSKSPVILEILAHNNKISSLEITRLPNLLYLDVERNALSQITLPIGNMQIFRAGQNRLNAYPNTNQVPSLRQLYLNHNRLGGDYPHLIANVNLQILNVAFNNIESLAGTNLMPSLEEIYAYNNIIDGFHGFYINGSGGGNLKVADFSSNKIITIIDLPDSLVYLDMSYNKFAGELQMKSPIPTGMSRDTSYPVKAHEVYSGHDVEYGQANSFVGTFDIRENQISGLPGKLPEAWLEFAAKSSGRMVYNMIVKYNILDIDIYDITTPKVDGHVPRNTGEQKWLSINPEANIVVQQYMDYESVIGAIEPELRLFHPIKKIYELPSRVHKYHYWWNKLEYEDIVSPLSNLIRQTGYIPIKVRINGTGWEDIGSINGFVPVPINVIDKRENPNQTTPNAGMAKTYLIDGETGKVTILSSDDDDKNYNPNTGASA